MDEQNQTLNPEIQNQNNQEDKEKLLSSHDRKILKKQEREQQRQRSEDQKSKKQTNKKIIKYSIIGVVVLLILYGGYSFLKSVKSLKPYFTGPYHWHANIEVSLCGEIKPLRCTGSMCGLETMHHHNDDIIHIEGSGTILKKENLAVGNFFDNINVPFTLTQIMDKKNGDLCNGKPGTVKMFVNGIPNNQFRDYIITQCDAQEPAEIKQRCDRIQVNFE